MERPGASSEGLVSGARSREAGAARIAATLLAATIGGIAGIMLWIPLSIITPFWIVWTLPQLFGAIFASSMAYLVSGPTKATLSRSMAFSLVFAAACGAVNLVVGASPWIEPFYDLLPPGGQKTLLLEAMVIGAVPCLVTLSGGRGERWR